MIPKHIREALGISPGDLVRVTVGKEDVQVVGEQEKPREASMLT